MAEIYRIGSDDLVDRISQFGGTNLLGATYNPTTPTIGSGDASCTFRTIGGYNSPKTAFTLEVYDNCSNALVLSETATGNRGVAWWTLPGAITAGTTYTFSCLLKPSVAITAHMHTGWRNGSATAAYTGWTSQNNVSIPANTWTKYCFTFQPNASAQLSWEYEIGICFTGQSGGVTCRFAHAKLEKGTKPTDWTPAPKDLVTISGTELKFFQ